MFIYFKCPMVLSINTELYFFSCFFFISHFFVFWIFIHVTVCDTTNTDTSRFRARWNIHHNRFRRGFKQFFFWCPFIHIPHETLTRREVVTSRYSCSGSPDHRIIRNGKRYWILFCFLLTLSVFFILIYFTFFFGLQI